MSPAVCRQWYAELLLYVSGVVGAAIIVCSRIVRRHLNAHISAAACYVYGRIMKQHRSAMASRALAATPRRAMKVRFNWAWRNGR